MTKETKKKWRAPRLLILLRNNPAESVLSGCKMIAVKVGSSDTDQGCYAGPYSSECDKCLSIFFRSCLENTYLQNNLKQKYAAGDFRLSCRCCVKEPESFRHFKGITDAIFKTCTKVFLAEV